MPFTNALNANWILAAIIEKFCEPQVAIVSLTITEAIVFTWPPVHSTPVIRGLFTIYKPLKNLTPHRVLVEALKRRRERGLTPFTVLSCANIPDNGHVVKNAVLGMAEKRSPELAGWIKEHVSFPEPWSTALFRLQPTNHWQK